MNPVRGYWSYWFGAEVLEFETRVDYYVMDNYGEPNIPKPS